MRFALSPEQRQFAAGLHALLAAADVPAVARAWADGDADPGLDLWRRLGDLGVAALAVPEEFGGLGAHPVDLVVAFEELGHHAVPGPLVESLAVVPALLAGLPDRAVASSAGGHGVIASGAGGHGVIASGAGGHGDPARRWLPALAEGKATATIACPPQVPYALDADRVDLVLLAEDGTLRVGEPGAPVSSVDDTRRLFPVVAGEQVVHGAEVSSAIGRAVDLGVLACSAQLLGAGRALLETGTEYAKQRIQFGRPIGSFQAVKHQLADVLVGLELARPLVFGAALALAEGSPTAARDVSAAKVATSTAAYRAGRVALQVHGALGYTREYHLGQWLTKVRALKSAWGTESAHRARVMASLS